jgi:hypothetical protein
VFTGDVRLTKNPSGICQLSRIAERGNTLTAATRMELQLGRATTKTDDYTIPVCTVTASLKFGRTATKAYLHPHASG